jgi:chromosome segregation ATPase
VASSSQAQTTHPYPSNPDTRSKVVEILSAAANGCLAELGYDPYRVATLEQTAKNWQDENVQLYEDNTHLSRKVSWLESQLKLSPNEALKSLAAVQNENANLLKERDALLRRIAGLEQQAAQLRSEYTKVSQAKVLLESTVRQLRKQVRQAVLLSYQT